jgi:hypothetical protein
MFKYGGLGIPNLPGSGGPKMSSKKHINGSGLLTLKTGGSKSENGNI